MRTFFLLVALLVVYADAQCSTPLGCLKDWYNGLNPTTQAALNAQTGWSSLNSVPDLVALCATPPQGVTCSAGALTQLKITASLAATTGPIPGILHVFNHLNNIATLEVLDFSSTGLNAPISATNAPVAASLKTLKLSGNPLITGTIPEGWYTNNVQILNLNGCSLNLITASAMTSSLVELDLTSNSYQSSSSFSEFCSSNLRKLVLASQKVSFMSSGNLFENLFTAGCTQLRHFDIGKNSFGARVFPAWLTSITTLEYLDITSSGQPSTNNFAGSAPTGSFPNLKTFINNQAGSANKLTANFYNSVNLEHLELDLQAWNLFTTAQFKLFTKLTYLSIRNTDLPEAIDLSAIAHQLVHLELVSISPSTPFLIGDIMTPFISSHPVSKIIITNNDFGNEEAIPSIFYSLENLDYLDLRSNALGGTLPVQFATSSVKSLILAENSIGGALVDLTNSGTKYYDELKLAYNKICPASPGDYATWGLVTDASLGSCLCVDTDCSNDCGCTVTPLGKIFPCVKADTLRGSNIVPPGFYGDRCLLQCHSTCFQCTGPNANQCITCNNARIQTFFSLSPPYAIGNNHLAVNAPFQNMSNTCPLCGEGEFVDNTTHTDSMLLATNFIHDRCTPAPTTPPPTTPPPTTPPPTTPPPSTPPPTPYPCTLPRRIDRQEQYCAEVPGILGKIWVHNSQNAGTNTNNIHITFIGRWGRRSAQFIRGAITPGQVVTKTFYGMDVGPLIGFELGSFSSTNDFRYYKVTLQRLAHKITPEPVYANYTVGVGPTRTWSRNTAIAPGYSVLLSSGGTPNPIPNVHSFNDPIIDPPSCASNFELCPCTVLDGMRNDNPASPCYWNFPKPTTAPTSMPQ